MAGEGDPIKLRILSIATRTLLGTRASVEDVIARVLRLSGGADDKLAVIAELFS